jgi:hypothetical protein
MQEIEKTRIPKQAFLLTRSERRYTGHPRKGGKLNSEYEIALCPEVKIKC